MTTIIKATPEEAALLSRIATSSFIESHGKSAPVEDVQNFVDANYNEQVLFDELQQPENIFHLIYYREEPAGYSKIIFDTPLEGRSEQHLTKLERIYLLEKFYEKKLGLQLFNYNITLAKQNNQQGIWLYVWNENQRAFNFYIKNGFEIIGSYDFKLSENHSNPNYIMLLRF